MAKKLIFNFNGTDEATAYVDDVSGVSQVFLINTRAALDTAQKKFGDSSLLVMPTSGATDGQVYWKSTDQSPAGPTITGDFTLQGWFRYDDTITGDAWDEMRIFRLFGDSSRPDLFLSLGPANETYTEGPIICCFARDKNAAYEIDYTYISETTLTTNTWYHWSVCASGRDVYFWLKLADGTTVYSQHWTMNVDNPFDGGYILQWRNQAHVANMWIDGVQWDTEALYVSDYTPPATEPSLGITFPMLTVSGELRVEKKEITGTITFPSLTVNGSLRTPGATLEASIPAVKGAHSLEYDLGNPAVGWGGGEATPDIPAIVLSASATLSPVMGLATKIPAVRLTASAIQDHIASLTRSIAPIRISAGAYQSPVASLAKKIPAVKLTASATTGYVASLEKSIGAVKLDALAYWLSGASLDTSIPPVRIVARAYSTVDGVREDFEVLCFNPKVMGLTKYTNYDFNSLCMFNGKPLGAKADGIYELEGVDDDGDIIYWKADLGKIDLKGNKIKFVIVSGKFTDDVILAAELPDGTSYEYRGESVSEYEGEIRIKPGKGLKDRYLSLELKNENECDVKIDSITVFALDTGLKR